VRPSLESHNPAASGGTAAPNGTDHNAADSPLGYAVLLVEVIGGGPLLVQAHHFFFAMS
jgi:hypothetical protein